MYSSVKSKSIQDQNKSVLTFYCCIIYYHKVSDLKVHKNIIRVSIDQKLSMFVLSLLFKISPH